VQPSRHENKEEVSLEFNLPSSFREFREFEEFKIIRDKFEEYIAVSWALSNLLEPYYKINFHVN
jgi:hypothetical protein